MIKKALVHLYNNINTKPTVKTNKIINKLYDNHQKNFIFDHAVISSAFECGNLKDVRVEGNHTYYLTIGEDYKANRFNNKNWFYFKFQNRESARDLILSIENMSYNWSMWKNGVTPVFKSKLTDWQWKIMDLSPVQLRLSKSNLL